MKNAARFLLLLLFIVPARAEETARFLIERIEVRHLSHASPEVIKAESRLREGQTYSEDDLRAASDRVKRLAFVLEAGFSLERGSVRNAYVLVITVNEARSVFYQYDFVPVLASHSVLTQVDDEASLGVRWFAGKSGVFHLASLAHQDDRAFESSYIALQAGYTRYGLLSDRAFATFTVSHFIARQRGGKGSTLPGVLFGLSLTPNQTLTISYSGIDAGSTNRRDERILESRLAYNTTNNPYFPSEGTLVSIAPIFAWIDAVDHTDQHVAFHDRDLALDAHAARYWTLREGLTAAAVLDGGTVNIARRGYGAGQTFNLNYGSASVRLWRAVGDTSSDRDRRIELMVSGVSHHRDFIPLLKDTSTQATISWVQRNSWGVLRLGLGYAW